MLDWTKQHGRTNSHLRICVGWNERKKERKKAAKTRGKRRRGRRRIKEGRKRHSNERPRKKPIGVEGFKKEGRAEEEQADRKEEAAEEGVINRNEDCLAKCEWPASENIDG